MGVNFIKKAENARRGIRDVSSSSWELAWWIVPTIMADCTLYEKTGAIKYLEHAQPYIERILGNRGDRIGFYDGVRNFGKETAIKYPIWLYNSTNKDYLYHCVKGVKYRVYYGHCLHNGMIVEAILRWCRLMAENESRNIRMQVMLDFIHKAGEQAIETLDSDCWLENEMWSGGYDEDVALMHLDKKALELEEKLAKAHHSSCYTNQEL